MKKIVLTGGGTAGHVTPNIALISALKEAGYEIEYIGSYEGIEKTLIEKENISYHGISTGKLRRYFDLKNFSDPFRVIKGFAEAKSLLKEIKPDIIFSKGGFVAVPVVRAAAALKIPVVAHESDMTPGLANKLSFPVATKVCCTFDETVKYLPEGKGVVTGSPIRDELLKGDKNKALSYTGFTSDKAVLLVIGGSLGAGAINEAIRRILPKLLEKFQIVHICGKGKLDPTLNNQSGYVQYEYVSEELKDIFALSDLVVSRAGSNAVCELLALNKPNLLIPLSANASRGDQVLNAHSFEKKGYSMVLEEENMTDESLYQAIMNLFNGKDNYINVMSQSKNLNAIDTIVNLIEQIVGGADD